MTYFKRLTLLLLISTVNSVCYADNIQSLNIIANSSIQNLSLSKHEIKNIFMGGISKYPFKAIHLEPGNIHRVVFNTKVIGLTESRIQSYWVQMRFSGRKKPPMEFNSLKKLLNFMIKTPNRISYIPSSYPIPEGFVIIYQVK